MVRKYNALMQVVCPDNTDVLTNKEWFLRELKCSKAVWIIHDNSRRVSCIFMSPPYTFFENRAAQFYLFAYCSKLCKIDKAVILRAAFHADDAFMVRGEVEIADSLLEFVCCYPDIEMV